MERNDTAHSEHLETSRVKHVCFVALVGLFLALQFPGAPLAADADAYKKLELSAKAQGKYVLVRTHEIGYSMCEEFTRNLNEFEDIPFDVCAPRLSVKYSRFSRPKWDEIPFNLDFAERIVKDSFVTSNPQKKEKGWKKWLIETDSSRKEGRLTMWETKVDIDGRKRHETVFRMSSQASSKLFNANESCVYRDSTLHIDREKDEFGKQFNFAGAFGDLIFDDVTRMFFLVASSPYPGTGSGLWGQGPPIVIPNATRGIAIYKMYRDIGPAAECNIQWVPSSAYHLSQEKK